MELKVSLEYSDKTSCFEKLFSNASRKVSVVFMNIFNVSRGPFNLDLSVAKKS